MGAEARSEWYDSRTVDGAGDDGDDDGDGSGDGNVCEMFNEE